MTRRISGGLLAEVIRFFEAYEGAYADKVRGCLEHQIALDLADARARIEVLEKQLAELHKQLRWMVRGWDRCHHNEITHEECVTIGNVRAYLAALAQAEDGK